MSADLGTELGKLLDQYDDTRRAAQTQKDQAAAEGELFLEQFAGLRRDVVRPVFEAVGAVLTQRGHQFSIHEEQFTAAGAGKSSSEAAIVLRIMPAGMVKPAPADDDVRALSFTTRHYNKTISVRNGAVPYEGAGKAAYAPARITRQLVEDEVLKLVAALVKS